MMLPRDDFTGVPELGYDEWRAVVRSVAGRYNPECIDPKAFAGRVRERPSPQALRIAAASNALARRLEKAGEAMAGLRLLEPRQRISNLTDPYPLRRPEDLAILAEGLRKAGLPE